MSDKISYTKPGGQEIVINATPEAKAYVKSLGWKETNRIKKPEQEQQLDNDK